MPAQWPQTHPDGTPIRVILYARVSTEEQGEAGRQGLDAQIHEMRELANEFGWSIVNEYREKASGASRTRPLLTYALHQLKAREADALMVHDLSRLARSLLFTLTVFEQLLKQNALLVSKRERHYDLRDPNDRFFLSLLAAMHEYSLELLKSHTRKGKRERARKGMYNASIIPLGYQHSGKPELPPTIIADEAAIVLEAFERHALGIHSDRQVANWLNAKGYRTRNKKRFTTEMIREMLQNPFYIGKIAYGRRHGEYDELYDGQHEPLVSLALWEKCQQVRQARRGSVRAKVPTFRPYLLSGLAVCDVCGDPLRSQTQQSGQMYYRENSHEHGTLDCPHRRKSIRTDVADAQMHAIVRTIELDDEWRQDFLQYLRDDTDLQAQFKRRRQVLNEMSELRHQKQRGEFDHDPQAYFRDYERLQAELAQLPANDESEETLAVFASPASFRAVWSGAAAIDQRDLLRLMVSEVRVAMDTGHIVAFTPFEAIQPLFRNIPGLVQRADGSFVVIALPDQSTVPNLTRLPDLISTTLIAPPFFAEIPIPVEENTRLAPALSEALQRCRKAQPSLHTLLQIESPYVRPLPADVRRWSGVTAHTLNRAQIAQQPAESVDVVATYLHLWDVWTNSASEPNTPELIQAIVRMLTPGGVWYALEVLPTDLPAHWLWRFFDEAHKAMSQRIPTLLTLNKELQDAGLTTTVQRRVYAQRVRLDVALQIAEQRRGLLARLPDNVYARGVENIRQAIARDGAQTFLDSRVALVEWWGQKQ